MAERALRAVPEGMHNVTVHLWFNGDCAKALDFYQKALGAELMFPPIKGPDGKNIAHSMIKIGDTPMMLADAWPGQWESGPKDGATAGLWVYVEDCDALYNRAVDAGCEVGQEMMDTFWGDRMGKVKDPFGHYWVIATHQWIMTEEEMKKGQEEWMQSMQG